MKVKVRFDEYDVSQAWVINPFSLRDEPLTPCLKKYMAGLSLYAHGCITRNVIRPKRGQVDERALLSTRQTLDGQAKELVERARKYKGDSLSNPVAKYLGYGQKVPFAQDVAWQRGAETLEVLGS
jgi:hypothetical protein